MAASDISQSFRAICIGIGAVVSLVGCGPPPAVEDQYGGSWGNPTTNVMRALISNNIVGCGEFYQQENTQYEGEYMVACHQGEGRWTLYQVWPRMSEVQRVSLSESDRIGGLPDISD